MTRGAATLPAALLALAAVPPAAAQEASLPRVIYGDTPPQVIYGPPSDPPPEASPPRRAPPEAPPPREETTLERGWLPIGPPVWVGPPVRPRPPPPGWRPPPPRIPDQPMPRGRLRGATPDARAPLERR